MTPSISPSSATAAAPNKVSPSVPREIMDNVKVQRIAKTSDHQVLSAVEALLSLSPVMHQEVAAKKASISTASIVNIPYMPKPPSGTVSPCESSVGSSEEEETTTKPQEYFEGSCELWCPEDEECLSPLHCFMRKYCVEAFTAKAFDISTPKFGRSLGRSIEIGQLGVQCKWCKHRNYNERQERAVCFPSTIKNIYHSIETWQRRHSGVCQDIPDWAKAEMTKLMQCSRSGAGGRRLYWEESAKRMGMVDTDGGVRFLRPPGTIDPPEPKKIVLDAPKSEAVVRKGDLDLHITGYLFHLLEQMETCYFSEEDRIGGRSKVKSCEFGYPGLQCKHCGGKSGFGRYFPASCAALSSANSDRNIFNHLSKCRKCPQDVRDQLTSLFDQQNAFKNRRGTRKIFFQRIWARMHNLKMEEETPETPPTSSIIVVPPPPPRNNVAVPSSPPERIIAREEREFAAQHQQELVARQQEYVVQQQQEFAVAQQHQLAAQRHRQHLAAQQLATQHRHQQVAAQHRHQQLVLSEEHQRPVMLQHQSLLMRSRPPFAVPSYMQQQHHRYNAMMQQQQQQQGRPYLMYIDPSFRLSKDVPNSTSV